MSLFLITGLNFVFIAPVYGERIPDSICVLLEGDFPDPSIVKDGDDHYMTTSCNGFPGLMIWHSRDLLRRKRLDYALSSPVEGAVWAPE